MSKETGKELILDDPSKDVLKRRGYSIAKYSFANGAFGWVYKGTAIRTGVTVAIKVIELKEMDPYIEEHFFPKEVDALIAIRHKHIISIYDVWRANFRAFVVMEVCIKFIR